MYNAETWTDLKVNSSFVVKALYVEFFYVVCRGDTEVCDESNGCQRTYSLPPEEPSPGISKLWVGMELDEVEILGIIFAISIDSYILYIIIHKKNILLCLHPFQV